MLRKKIEIEHRLRIFLLSKGIPVILNNYENILPDSDVNGGIYFEILHEFSFDRKRVIENEIGS